MKLYEINDAINSLLEKEVMDPETGEIFDDVGFEELKGLETALEVKLENTALFIKNLEAETKAFKEEEKVLAERRRVKENKLINVKNFLKDFLVYEKKDKFETTKCRLSFIESTAVQIDDLELIPKEFKKKKVTVSPDKMAIKKAIKAGEELAGARLVESKNLQVK